jgi:hypothetical protein
MAPLRGRLRVERRRFVVWVRLKMEGRNPIRHATSFHWASSARRIGVPGYELFFCTVGGVPIEFMGSYPDKIDRWETEATNS